MADVASPTVTASVKVSDQDALNDDILAVIDLPIAAGRLPSDLDILVPRAHLGEAQSRLRDIGWVEPALDEHDRRYYLQWSHELPPMQHAEYSVELDVHHHILPPRIEELARRETRIAPERPHEVRLVVVPRVEGRSRSDPAAHDDRVNRRPVGCRHGVQRDAGRARDATGARGDEGDRVRAGSDP